MSLCLRFCDIYGNFCFETSMNDYIAEDDCNCPLECTSIKYQYNYYSSPFDFDILCGQQDGRIEDDFLMKEFLDNPMPPKLLRKMEKYVLNVTNDDEEICRTNLKYKAEVIFRLATDSMTVTVSSKRLSFFDKVSGFGKQKD